MYGASKVDVSENAVKSAFWLELKFLNILQIVGTQTPQPSLKQKETFHKKILFISLPMYVPFRILCIIFARGKGGL